jgi:hypothetical protein
MFELQKHVICPYCKAHLELEIVMVAEGDTLLCMGCANLIIFDENKQASKVTPSKLAGVHGSVLTDIAIGQGVLKFQEVLNYPGLPRIYCSLSGQVQFVEYPQDVFWKRKLKRTHPVLIAEPWKKVLSSRNELTRLADRYQRYTTTGYWKCLQHCLLRKDPSPYLLPVRALELIKEATESLEAYMADIPAWG